MGITIFYEDLSARLALLTIEFVEIARSTAGGLDK